MLRRPVVEFGRFEIRFDIKSLRPHARGDLYTSHVVHSADNSSLQ